LAEDVGYVFGVIFVAVIALAILAVVLAVVYRLLRVIVGKPNAKPTLNPQDREPGLLDLLNRKLVAGEITAERYQTVRRILEAGEKRTVV
jgi:uncharacterized membrane protein